MWLAAIAAFVLGVLIGIVATLLFRRRQEHDVDEITKRIFEETQQRSKAEMSALLESTKSELYRLSSQSLKESTEELLKLADSKLGDRTKLSDQELQGKKELIDQQLAKMNAELEKVSTLITDYEKDRSTKFGALSQGIEEITRQTDALKMTTGALKEALSSSQARGQWGQRMADDVLRLAGLVEGVNFSRQTTQPETGQRPDYTFFLPNSQTVNMDVKFPLDNYLKYLQSENDVDRESSRKTFLRDVRNTVKSLNSRDYVAADGSTVDYVLLFIPNESVYSFVHKEDPSLMDDALSTKVILCSPMTLFAVLAVVRQSIENFALQQTSNEMLSLFGTFRKQWDKFNEALAKLGNKISSLQSDYGTLTTTRKNQLEKPLLKIEDLRVQQAIPVSAIEDDSADPSDSEDDFEEDFEQ
jgi:DNA recombination protein RmuC